MRVCIFLNFILHVLPPSNANVRYQRIRTLFSYTVGRLTCAHDSGRVRVPPSICSTHCLYPPSWDKPCVTFEEYLSSLSCVLICLNEAIYWENRVAAVGWRE